MRKLFNSYTIDAGERPAESEKTMIDVYSDGKRIIGLESVIGYDLENPMSFWLDGMDKSVYILTKLDEFSNGQNNAYNDIENLIDDQSGFNGCTQCMSSDNIRAYVDKRFFTIPFSKGEHGLVAYWVGCSNNWDCATAGFFLLPRNEWTAKDANDFSLDVKTLMQCMTSWANGDEYAIHDITINNGCLHDDCCFGFYGRDDALSDACIDGYNYIGAFDSVDECATIEDDNAIMRALLKQFPDSFSVVEHIEHIPAQVRYIPAHDNVWTEFVQN
jgi:hypothetical protein